MQSFHTFQYIKMDTKHEECTMSYFRGFALETILPSPLLIEHCEKLACSLSKMLVWDIREISVCQKRKSLHWSDLYQILLQLLERWQPTFVNVTLRYRVLLRRHAIFPLAKDSKLKQLMTSYAIKIWWGGMFQNEQSALPCFTNIDSCGLFYWRKHFQYSKWRHMGWEQSPLNWSAYIPHRFLANECVGIVGDRLVAISCFQIVLTCVQYCIFPGVRAPWFTEACSVHHADRNAINKLWSALFHRSLILRKYHIYHTMAGRGGPVAWFSSLWYLSAFECFLWGHLTELVYDWPVDITWHLVARIVVAEKEYRQYQEFLRGCSNHSFSGVNCPTPHFTATLNIYFEYFSDASNSFCALMASEFSAIQIRMRR